MESSSERVLDTRSRDSRTRTNSKEQKIMIPPKHHSNNTTRGERAWKCSAGGVGSQQIEKKRGG